MLKFATHHFFASLAAVFLSTSQALPHVFTVTVDPDSVVAGRGSVEAALPTALATAIVEDLLADSMRKSGSDLRGNRGGNRGRI